MSNGIHDTAATEGRRSPLSFLGPGLITDAADDDPSGIATYSQAGAQFGLGLAWTMLFTFPMLAVVQEISARIGRTTGKGIAANLRDFCPRPLLFLSVALLAIANAVNLGADLGAMAEAVQLLVGGIGHIYVIAFGAFCAVVQIYVPYARYVTFLKWLTLSLLAYAATLMVIDVPWATVARRTVWPALSRDRDYIVALVAVFGTTIAPYLVFWQASEEVDEMELRSTRRPLRLAPDQAPAEIRRIRLDTYSGIGISNLQSHRALHYRRNCADPECARREQHRDGGTGGRGPAPRGWAIRLHRLRGRDHRHRLSGCSCARRLIGLCDS